MGNMLAWHTVNPGSIPGRGGYIVTCMITIMAFPFHWIPSGTYKNLGDDNKRSSRSKVKIIGKKHDFHSMTLNS